MFAFGPRVVQAMPDGLMQMGTMAVAEPGRPMKNSCAPSQCGHMGVASAQAYERPSISSAKRASSPRTWKRAGLPPLGALARKALLARSSVIAVPSNLITTQPSPKTAKHEVWSGSGSQGRSISGPGFDASPTLVALR